MTAFAIACAWLGGYLILACIGSAGWSFAASRLKRKRPPEPEHVNWLPFLPPVPLPVSRHDDAAWLDAWPTEARWVINTDAMEQERCDRLFDDIVRGEFA